MDINTVIQLFIAVIMLISVILIYKTISSNKSLNQKIIFNEIVKQERELRIKLGEYREEIHKRSADNSKELILDYDTLLFNYYEYLAICIHQNFINEEETKKYFLDLLKEVKEKVEQSILFKEGYAQKEQYKALQWLFKKWGV